MKLQTAVAVSKIDKENLGINILSKNYYLNTGIFPLTHIIVSFSIIKLILPMILRNETKTTKLSQLNVGLHLPLVFC